MKTLISVTTSWSAAIRVISRVSFRPWQALYRALLVTNHAFLSGRSEHFAVFGVFVKDRAQPLPRPK